MAIVSSVTPAISGRYDLAIVVAKGSRDRLMLMALAFWITVVLCVVLFVVLLLAFAPISKILGASKLEGWLLFTPTALFLTAIGSILRYYANSQKDYGLLSELSVIHAIGSAVLTVTLGWIGLGASGLIMASLSSLALVCVYLIYRYRSTWKNMTWHWCQDMKSLALRYKDYPLFSAPTSFLDGVLLSLPVFFLTKYFPEDIVGYYALLTRVATAPLGFIVSAVAQVHLKKTADLIHGKNDSIAYLRKITLVMIAIVFLPTVFFMTVAPALFALVFGESWLMAGELLVILMPSLALRSVVSPLSGSLISTGHVRLGSAWQLIAFLVTFVMFTIVAPRATVHGIFYSILITDLVLYSLYYLFILFAVNHPKIV